jgi:hypothetical protein
LIFAELSLDYGISGMQDEQCHQGLDVDEFFDENLSALFCSRVSVLTGNERINRACAQEYGRRASINH